MQAEPSKTEEDRRDAGRAFLLHAALSHWRFKLVLSAVISFVFWASYLLVQRFPLGAARPAPSLPVDAWIPFWPAAVYLYESLWLLQAVAPWLMRDRRQLTLYCLTLLVILIPALVVFLLWPTASPRPPCTGLEPALYRALIRIDLDLNAFPSLHAAFAVYSGLGCRSVFGGIRFRAAVMALIGVWTAGILAATLLTKQHTVPDMLAGTLLGWGAHRLYVRSTRKAAG